MMEKRLISCFFLFVWSLEGLQAAESKDSNGTSCQNLGPSELAQKLRDTGKFNEKYMAVTLDEAARNFPDLTDRHFMRSTQRYVCEQSCQEKTERLKQRLNGKGQKVDWPRVRHGSDAPPSPTPPGDRRTKREGSLKSSVKLENIGQSYFLYCSPEGFEDQPGYRRLCGACRSLRELPEDYFPRFLNEVRCQGTQCVKEHGQCVQKYLNFDILRNEGTKDCQRWVPYTANVPVCCDCLLSSQSTIFLSMVQKES